MTGLEQFAAWFQDLFLGCPIPMILVDAEGRILMINEAYADFLGTQVSSALRRKITEVIPNTRAPQVLQTGIAELAAVMRYSNGKEAVVHRIPLYENGKIIGLFGMLLFKSVGELEELIIKNHLLEREIDYYKRQLKQLHGTKYDLSSIIGDSPTITRCKQTAQRIARLDANVLIVGESGVGKELFAHAIHNESPRRHYPFVRVNCAAIPEPLLEAELFGYEEGAFTGASRKGRIGKFEQAHRGTLFLDEIGDMPLSMQAKILRVLQEGELERVGGRELIPVDVRVVAASHRNLEEMVERGVFRQDLYYRLNVLSLRVPPLRERPEDIPLLAQHFLAEFGRQTGLSHRLDTEVLELLARYPWPGNVRELRNVVFKMIATVDEDIITLEHLPRELRRDLERGGGRLGFSTPSLDAQVHRSEREVILEALHQAGNNRSRAAKLLGIPRSRLYRKLAKYGIGPRGDGDR